MAKRKQAPRDTTKYEFTTQGGKLVRKGITGRDLAERQRELRREENMPRGKIKQVGRATTHDAARTWEDRQRKGTPPGGK